MEDEDLRRFYREVVRRLKDVPGVEAVAAMNELPRSRGASTISFTIDGLDEMFVGLWDVNENSSQEL